MDADRVTERLGHLLHAVQADQERQRHDDLGLETLLAHQIATEKQVEELVRAAQLDVRPQGDRVVALGERVEQLVEGDRLPRRPALLKVVALEDPGDRDTGSEPDESLGAEGREPRQHRLRGEPKRDGRGGR